jgi:hypothetical protein
MTAVTRGDADERVGQCRAAVAAEGTGARASRRDRDLEELDSVPTVLAMLTSGARRSGARLASGADADVGCASRRAMAGPIGRESHGRSRLVTSFPSCATVRQLDFRGASLVVRVGSAVNTPQCADLTIAAIAIEVGHESPADLIGAPGVVAVGGVAAPRRPSPDAVPCTG